ncbi:MAG: hypothetical protein LKF99_04310 [Bifidobacterium sp.]|jgi:hypothetical protein|nr:hypothetical protein [Bifidobacterium sp.]
MVTATASMRGTAPPSIAKAIHAPSTVLRAHDLPGPMILHRLTLVGAVHKLDSANAYLAEHADTLYGRGAIVKSVAPGGTVSCAVSAAWVWLGGDFPKTIDVVSSSHFRSLTYGRKIRVFNRNTPPEHLTTIGQLRLTTPQRTACDIALLCDEESIDIRANEMVCALMESYAFRPTDCLHILAANRFWQNAPRARQFFSIIEHCF